MTKLIVAFGFLCALVFAAPPQPSACFVDLQRARLSDGYRKCLTVAEERFLLWLVIHGQPDIVTLLQDVPLLNHTLIEHLQYLVGNQFGDTAPGTRCLYCKQNTGGSGYDWEPPGVLSKLGRCCSQCPCGRQCRCSSYMQCSPSPCSWDFPTRGSLP